MPNVVILGGSFTGLAAALVLARDGHQVTVLERDPAPLPASSEEWDRPTVPQARQAHSTMALGRAILARRLPDVLAALLDDGAVEHPLETYVPPTAAGSADSALLADLVPLACRRSAYERVLRRCVEADAGIDLRTGVTVTGLRWRPGPLPWADGVTTREHGPLDADIVLDASGRRTALPRWARDAGAEIVEQTEDTQLVYHTRFFRVLDPESMPRMARGNATVLILDGACAFAFLCDNDTVAVAIARLTQDRALEPLRDPALFDRAARAVPPIAPWVDRDRVAPISGVAVMGGIRNTLRSPLRDGRPVLLGVHPVGDTLAITDPTFGRGLSLALAQIEVVADGLRAEPDPGVDQAALIGHGLTAIAETHWRDSVRHDRARTNRWRATIGLPPGPAAPPTAVPMPVAGAASMADAAVWVRLMRAVHLLEPPGSVFDDDELAEHIAGLGIAPPRLPACRSDLLAALDADLVTR
jgi:2-polyprenyl-6-methoxyphenol hydroxylase-like FAD-dependent oxidoreductase